MRNYIAIKTLLESFEWKNLIENHRKTCTGNKNKNLNLNFPTTLAGDGGNNHKMRLDKQ
jgi:hypothetical protein